MDPQPRDEMRDYVGRGLLEEKIALITGGDSGIGRAVAVAFAKEGEDIAIAYLSEHEDAGHTASLVQAAGRRCQLLPADLSVEDECRRVVQEVAREYGELDVLVNNIAYQAPADTLEAIATEQWDRTFKTNIYSYFWVTKEALGLLPDGGAIINTSSINGLRGNKGLIDYSATKGAINAFTYAMAQSLVERGIRVNAVAPGPVWTPLIPSTMDQERVEGFGAQTPLGRAAQPDEIAPSYVFFAAEQLSSYYTGECWRPSAARRCPGERRASRQVPAEVDLDAAQLLAGEGHDFRVAEARPVRARGHVRDEHLVAVRDEPLEGEGREVLGARPAALEVPLAVDVDVGGAREAEVGGQVALEDAPVAGHVGPVALAGDLQAPGCGGIGAVHASRTARIL